MRFNKVGLVGVGLLGGSLGLALRERRLAAHVAGFVRRSASIGECLRHGAVDSASTDLDGIVQDADLVVLCTPVGQMAELARRIGPLLSPNAVVTDVGSVKQGVVAAVLQSLPPGRFVGSHPMAGSELTGVAAARADLFAHARCVITPTPDSHPDAIATLHHLWSGVGAVPIEMNPAEHDALVARSSHLPHVLAAVLARNVLAPGQPDSLLDLCASGFRDTTRVASGSPEMWRDIVLENRNSLLEALRNWSSDLAAFTRALEASDAAALEQFLLEARDRRELWQNHLRSRSLPETRPT